MSVIRHSRRAMTLIEMMVVLIIISLMLTVAGTSMKHVVPGWRLESTAHRLECTVRWAQNAAMAQGRPAQVMYDVPENACWARIGEEVYSYHKLPEGVRLVEIKFATGVDVNNDIAAATAQPDGTLDPHSVTLEIPEGRRVTLEYERLTGEMNYIEEPGHAP